ncbi:hypothetical protein HanOQP8_Chr05g0201211 [Helianthus annuus]|nr:hypothetical protein HanHA89_Chr05g0206801 [Helianthus annuus]KAJ0748439.1 hypothetical protein HanOQP8_Chr05g0201211 [Helianthus annuus]
MLRLCPTKFVWILSRNIGTKINLGVLYSTQMQYIFFSPKVIPKIYTRSHSS